MKEPERDRALILAFPWKHLVGLSKEMETVQLESKTTAPSILLSVYRDVNDIKAPGSVCS